ncbi:MAG: hypothetical protein P8012_12000 [Desulfobacterales bacterium]
MNGNLDIEQDNRASDTLKALNESVLPVLCRRLYQKGLTPIEVKGLTRDILNIIGDGGLFSVDILNRNLERLGWGRNVVDNYIFDLILYYLECEGTFKIEAYIAQKEPQ